MRSYICVFERIRSYQFHFTPACLWHPTSRRFTFTCVASWWWYTTHRSVFFFGGGGGGICPSSTFRLRPHAKSAPSPPVYPFLRVKQSNAWPWRWRHYERSKRPKASVRILPGLNRLSDEVRRALRESNESHGCGVRRKCPNTASPIL